LDRLYTVETHLHTAQGSACAHSTGAQMALAHKAAGYDAVIITDHFFGGKTAVPRDLPWAERIDRFCQGYEEARRTGEEIGLSVFFGWEWAWHGTEFLTYGLDKEYLLAHPEMEGWDIPTYLENVRAAGAFVSHAHPFRQADYLKGEPRLFPEYVDAVEVYNCGNQRAWNEQALSYAKRYGLAMTSGSDGHDADALRGGGMRFATPIKSLADFLRAVRTRQPFEVLTGEKEGFALGRIENTKG
jgi:hypothetical protein